MPAPRAAIADVVLQAPDGWWDVPSGGLLGRARAKRFIDQFRGAHPAFGAQVRALQQTLQRDGHASGAMYIADPAQGVGALLWVDLVQGESAGDARILLEDFIAALPADAMERQTRSSQHPTGPLIGHGATFHATDAGGEAAALVRKSRVVLAVENGLHQMVMLSMEVDLPHPAELEDPDQHLMRIAEQMQVSFVSE